MDKEIFLENVRMRLSTIGVDYESLNAIVQNYIVDIEAEVSKRFKKQREALQMLKENRININTIAKKGIISNKTIYKYKILVDYIKHCGDQYDEKLPYSRDAEAELREKLNTALEDIKKMDEHTVDIELLKLEIEELKYNERNSEARIKILLEENSKLTEELAELRMQQIIIK